MSTDKRGFWRIAASIRVPLWFVPLLLPAAPRWTIQYLYDHADANFAIEDLECPTAQRCIAAGSIDDKRGREEGAVVVTTDGGAHWSQYPVKERPLSLYFLNESLGWMVTDRGLWSTQEGGRSWTKIDSRKGIVQAWFLDPSHGYLAGLKGLVEETVDGGKSWKKLEAAGEAAVDYEIIQFQGLHGVIIGANQSATAILSYPAAPAASVGKMTLLETLDGGKKWTRGTVPVEGELAQVRMSDKGFSVSLILYSDSKSPVSTAVFLTPNGSRDSRPIFAEKDRAATDIALLPDGHAVVAAVEPPGNTTQVPIPGKLRMLASDNLKVWQEMDVDYRALAQRAVIAAPDAQHMWVATDTGAILKLVP
jgi:hypothetical protein